MRTALFLLLLTQSFPALAAQPGCLDVPNHEIVHVGGFRAFASGSMICSKTPDGHYIWVAASEFDMTSGCWYKDPYPEGSILKMGDQYRQCIKSNGQFKWVPSNACNGVRQQSETPMDPDSESISETVSAQ